MNAVQRITKNGTVIVAPVSLCGRKDRGFLEDKKRFFTSSRIGQ